MSTRIIRSFSAMLAALCLGAVQAADAPSGEALVKACAGCHGATGVSKIPNFPSIAGLDPAYFVDDMLGYKEGDIQNAMMARFAKPYTREQFEAMAEFYARQEWVPAKQKFDPAKAERGRVLHEQYCGMCHIDGGSAAGGRQVSIAPLGGQWTNYLMAAIKSFVEGKRPMPDGKPPRIKAFMAEYGDDGLDALMNYYASQQ